MTSLTQSNHFSTWTPRWVPGSTGPWLADSQSCDLNNELWLVVYLINVPWLNLSIIKSFIRVYCCNLIQVILQPDLDTGSSYDPVLSGLFVCFQTILYPLNQLPGGREASWATGYSVWYSWVGHFVGWLLEGNHTNNAKYERERGLKKTSYSSCDI